MNSSLRFLVVDDEVSIQRIGVRMLQREGYVCRVASSAFEAISILEQEHIDVMLTDIAMPGLDGLELAQLTKTRYPGLAVVVVSGRSDETTVKKARQAGAADFVSKPFHPSDFIAAAARAVHFRARRWGAPCVYLPPDERPRKAHPALNALLSEMH